MERRRPVHLSDTEEWQHLRSFLADKCRHSLRVALLRPSRFASGLFKPTHAPTPTYARGGVGRPVGGGGGEGGGQGGGAVKVVGIPLASA